MKGSIPSHIAVVVGGIVALLAGAPALAQTETLPRPIRGEMPAAPEELYVLEPPGIYVGTGNHDGRAPLRDGDDQVLRIAPARSSND